MVCVTVDIILWIGFIVLLQRFLLYNILQMLTSEVFVCETSENAQQHVLCQAVGPIKMALWFALVGGFDTELRWWYVFNRDGGWVILQYRKAGTTTVC